MKKHLLRFGLGILVLLLVLGHATQRFDSDVLNRLDNALYDIRLRLTLPGGVDERIVIIDIDEKALAEVGRWPWGRDKTAQLTQALFDQYGVKVLGFDVVFAEPDDSSGLVSLEKLARTDLSGDAAFQQELEGLRQRLDFDARFARTIKGRQVILGYYFTHHAPETSTATLPAPVFTAQQLGGSANNFETFSAYGGNLKSLVRAAAGAGHFVPIVDVDGIARRVALLAQFEGDYYESLSLAMTRAWLGYPKLELGFGDGALESLQLKGPGFDLTIPVDDNVAALIPYRGGQASFRYISAADVLSGKTPKAALAGKIAIVGTTAPGLLDLRSTPVGAVYPGVEIHANLIAGFLDGTIKYKPWFLMGADVLLTLAAGLVMALVLPLLSALRATLAALLVLALVIGVNFYAWQNNYVLPLAGNLVMIAVLYALNMAWGYFVESRTKRQLTGLFGQYVPPELVTEMSRDPENYSMAGRRAELTVLFSDVRGFTTISEGLQPDELAALMNLYLGAMTEVVRQHRGTLDKYIGDAIMAFWGAPVAEPRHAYQAVITALDMTAALPALNQQLEARGWPELKIGIGVNTGLMTVGDMGSRVRQSYTVMGDAVNLGSRLEGITKQYGVGILIGEDTWQEVKEQLVCRELDSVRVKGKNRPVGIYEPIGKIGEVDAAKLAELAAWQAALAAYRAQRWSDATRQLQELCAQSPAALYKIYLEARIPYLAANPPGAEWDGAWTFETK